MFNSKNRKESSNGKPKCTYCGGVDFLVGPSGGISTNILCSNPECRHWFNWTPAIPLLEDLNKVEPTATEAERQAADRQAKRDAEMAEHARLGAEDYRAGKPASSILMGHTWTMPGWPHIAWLVGWVQAAADAPPPIDPLTMMVGLENVVISEAPAGTMANTGVLTDETFNKPAPNLNEP